MSDSRVFLTHIRYFLNCLCLFKTETDCVYLETCQDSHCDIIFCAFAYFAREDAKVIDLISWKWVSIWCAMYMQKLILACIWETMVRFRCVGKVRIISTPNRNRKKCTFMRPGWCAVCAVPLSECALHSNVCTHINDLSQCASTTLRSINKQDTLSWGSSTGLIVQIADYNFRGAETTHRRLKWRHRYDGLGLYSGQKLKTSW